MTSWSLSPSRRTVLTGGLALALLPSCGTDRGDDLLAKVEELEASIGGRIGFATKNLATGDIVSHRGDERFAFCSSFKWLLGGLVLAEVDAGRESLRTELAYGRDDLLSHSPVLGPAVERGAMSLEELCAATTITSDNAAANLLIRHLGGPEGFTDKLRGLGDEVTRLDRYELELNEAKPGDPRDTTTPDAMLGTMERFLFGEILRSDSRELLRSWMIAATTGLNRLRAGIPDGWIAGDKTGTNLTNMNNDIAFAIPSEGAPDHAGAILIVSYLDAPNPFSAERNAAHASLGRAVFAHP